VIKQLQNPVVRFTLIGFFSYLLWYFFYELYLLPHTPIDGYLVDTLVKCAEVLLRISGFDLAVFDDGEFRNHIAIAGTPGVTVGAPCDGMILMALFVIFIFAYPGTNKRRLWFVPFGLITIQLLNVIRIASLALIVYWNEAYLSFNHDYTFTILVYSYVFFLWYWWSKHSNNMTLQREKNE
jgi:exosortase family protein XrtF